MNSQSFLKGFVPVGPTCLGCPPPHLTQPSFSLNNTALWALVLPHFQGGIIYTILSNRGLVFPELLPGVRHCSEHFTCIDTTLRTPRSSIVLPIVQIRKGSGQVTPMSGLPNLQSFGCHPPNFFHMCMQLLLLLFSIFLSFDSFSPLKNHSKRIYLSNTQMENQFIGHK